jgi:hypothetical protein
MIRPLRSVRLPASRTRRAAWSRGAARAWPLALPVLLALPACASSRAEAPPPAVTIIEEAPRWVFDAAHGWDAVAQPFLFHATGRAPIRDSMQAADAQARFHALADVQSFREAAVARLNASWAGEDGELRDHQALASALDSGPFAREVIEASAAGTRLIGKWHDDHEYHVWISYDAEEAFLARYSEGVAARLREQARELTPADRERLRRELASLVAERNGRP